MGFDAREQHAIQQVHADHVPYRRISQILGLPPTSVLRFVNALPASTTRVPDDVLGWCPWCGGRLYRRTDGKKQRFCCSEHRRAWWKAHPEAKRRTATYTFTCAGCATTFTAYGNKKRKYCSHACYVTHRGTA